MKKNKLTRVLALAMVVILLALYIVTMVFAVQKNENAQAMFRAALACTFILPVLLYIILLVAKLLEPKKSQAVDALIFDMGKVLLDFPWETCAEKMDVTPECRRVLEEKILHNPELWKKFDLNNKSYEQIMDEFAAVDPRYDREIRELVDHVDEVIKPFPYTEEWLRELKRHGYKLYWLSNWSQVTYERIKERGILDFMKYMDGGIWSFEVHLAKPDGRIFRLLADRYHLNKGRSIFIDDSEANVRAAQKEGFAAIHFTSFADASAKLEDAGVVV